MSFQGGLFVHMGNNGGLFKTRIETDTVTGGRQCN